jgi:hypothetical protein
MTSEQAKNDPTVPQNFQVSELTEGPGRFQVTFIYEFHQAMKKGTNEPYTSYQLYKSCAYTPLSEQDRVTEGNSGFKNLSGPGPHYKLRAVCNCERYVYVTAEVRVYPPGGKWVYLANPPGATYPRNAAMFVAPCKPAK